MANRRGVRRGVNEAVTVMLLLLVGVVAAFGIKAWLDSQASRLPATEIGVAKYSFTTSTPTRHIINLVVTNNLRNDVTLQAVRLTYSNGSVFTLTTGTGGIPSGITVSPSGVLGGTIPGKSDASLVIVVNAATGTYPARVEVQLRDSASGAVSWITAVGGG